MTLTVAVGPFDTGNSNELAISHHVAGHAIDANPMIPPPDSWMTKLCVVGCGFVEDVVNDSRPGIVNPGGVALTRRETATVWELPAQGLGARHETTIVAR